MNTGMPTGRPLSAKKIQNANGIQNSGIIPVYPTGFTAYQKKCWDMIFSIQNTQLNPVQDVFLVEQLCINLELIRRIHREIKKSDDLLITTNGGQTTMLSPLVSHLPKVQAQVASNLSQLGFSPMDRAKLNIIKETEDSDLLKFVKRGVANG